MNSAREVYGLVVSSAREDSSFHAARAWSRIPSRSAFGLVDVLLVVMAAGTDVGEFAAVWLPSDAAMIMVP
jgi:hypothetical protein